MVFARIRSIAYLLTLLTVKMKSSKKNGGGLKLSKMLNANTSESQ